ALEIWHKVVGLPLDRIQRRDAKDNYWSMGVPGPGGPCSEIYYDRGPEHGREGGPVVDEDRYLEVWNLVFMQDELSAVRSKEDFDIRQPLPAKNIDTGMGLERMAALLQGVDNIYEIDTTRGILDRAVELTGSTYGVNERDDVALRIVADHARTCAFLIGDGVIPGNEGRGYVLRRIIRRAIRHGYKLGARAAFFHRIVPDLAAVMGEAYPELVKAQSRVIDILRQEEERFFETIEHGMGILEATLKALPAGGTFDGELAFKLHDTYGFPLDLTADICREANVNVDTDAFDAAMAQQKAQARAAGKFKLGAGLAYDGAATTFHGYDTLTHDGTVLALYKDGAPVGQLNEGELGVVVLDRTPFYAESGGQIGDRGALQSTNGVFEVEDTQKIQAQVFGHHGVVKTGSLAVGDTVLARVDEDARARTMRNHSVTHLMHKALREVLGEHVQQKGSLVDSEKTRFDFVQPSPMSDAQIREVEARVNAEILANSATQARVMTIDEAQKTGAMMLFGEKYGDEVRVLDIGSSRELCGGTHVARTGDIGLFKVIAESGVAAGIRRVEATTGTGVLAYLDKAEGNLGAIAQLVKTTPMDAAERVAQLLEHSRTLEKELDRLKSRLAAAQGDELVQQAVEIAGVRVLAAQLDSVDAKALRETADKLRDKLRSCALVLGTVADGKVSLIAAVTPDIIGKIKAGELVNFVATQVGGKGGGKPDLAMAGGSEPTQLPAALASVRTWVQNKLA
ncbi:MAG: alanine--tRNA ligase, partial [Thiobacillus sp.]